MILSVEEAHLVILEDACKIANARWMSTGGAMVGEVFRPDPIRSKKGGLAISIDPMASEILEPEELEDMRVLARNSVHEAIGNHKGLLTRLIVGDARAGRNYFDRFK